MKQFAAISALALLTALPASADDVVDARFRSLGARVAEALLQLRLTPPPGVVVPLPAAVGGWVSLVTLRAVEGCELRVGNHEERGLDPYRDFDAGGAFCHRHGRRVSALSFQKISSGGVVVLSSHTASVFRDGTDLPYMVQVILHGVMRLMRFEQRAPRISGPLLEPVLALLNHS